MSSGLRSLSATDVARLLRLAPHPEGGFYRETFRDEVQITKGRAASTAIYYLIAQDQISAWHRVDATEVWHFYAGAPLELTISASGVDATTHRLGHDLIAGERPQLIVPASHWQSARTCGEWTLVGCTVAPGFEFATFELAPGGFAPTRIGRDRAGE
jgi:predicted cupin superfamily sugar epimerase